MSSVHNKNYPNFQNFLILGLKQIQILRRDNLNDLKLKSFILKILFDFYSVYKNILKLNEYKKIFIVF